MAEAFVFFVILSTVIFLLSWVLPKALSWIFERKYKVVFRIGRIGLLTFKLFDVHVLKNGYAIHIDELSIKSSFFNSDLTKLVTLILKDVRINKAIEQNDSFRKRMDFRGKKIPPVVTSCAQFMAVHMYNVSAILLRTDGCLIHTTAKELHLDSSVVQNAKTLLLNVDVNEGSAKILKHSNREATEGSCLAEVSFAVVAEATFIAQGPLSLEKLHLIVSQTNVVISEGFYYLERHTIAQGDILLQYEDEEEIFRRILPVIPKNFILQVEDTLLRSIRDNSKTNFNASLQILLLTYRTKSPERKYNELSNVSLNFKMCDLKIQTAHTKLLILNNLALDSQVQGSTVDLYLKLNTLLVTYDHDSIFNWLRTNFMRNRGVTMRGGVKRRNRRWLEKLAEKYVLNGCAEFCHVSTVIKVAQSSSSMGFGLVKVILEQAREKRGIQCDSHLLKLLLQDRHWQTEVLVESLYWSFADWTQDCNLSKRIHLWRTPAFLGMALVKFQTEENQDIKIESLLDTLQAEWSVELGDCVLLMLRCIEDYGGFQAPRSDSFKEPRVFNTKLAVSIVVTHINLFFVTEHERFVACLNQFSFEKKSKTSTIHLKELKFASVKSKDARYTCVRSEDILDYLAYLKLIQITSKKGTKKSELSIELLDELTAFWSPNLHLKLFHLYLDMSRFTSHFEYSNNDSRTVKFFSLHLLADFCFHVTISERHTAKIGLDRLKISAHDDDVLAVSSSAVISIDGADIFTLEGFNLCPIADNEDVRAERCDNEHFVLPWNRTWGVTIEMFRAVFPYAHNYAEAVQNEFVSLVKWLKVLHKRQKAPFVDDGPLPSDILINIKEFLFEVGDDPFEVKLRDNFELLVDEYHESQKRQKMLKDKISELLKTHLHLPAGKVEELYASLKKRNAEIYVQRSKQIASSSPPRTRLLAWNMSDVSLMILADPSIHGTENVTGAMKEMDPDSPWPEEGLEFSILWCRVISMTCKEWKFHLRDFPQPLLLMRHFSVCGQLVGAEQAAPKRAVRNVTVYLGEPFEPFIVERGMLPLKYYHDFNCEIESFSYAFGPCWEPVIAQCNLAMEKILPPSRDPSPPLPFWDKMRLLLHGRLTMVVKQLTVLLHASLDPYNTTEEMELTWNQVIMDWTNARFVFKGDLNIFVRTASKYDDCQLLHVPNLKLVVGIIWLCLGDPNDHHAVVQCAPDKVPEYSSNQVHDSFRAFRSQNVNLNITLETKFVANQSPTNLDFPILVLFNSTLRWFENLKLILSGVTRPTKRGRIFNNVRPRKIQLSRHYKTVHLLMGLHKFQVCYWMSYAKQRGCEMVGEKLSCSSEHTLSLIPIEDGLKHRPKAEWSIVYMNSELTNSEIWLKSALQEDPEKEDVSLRRPVEKCYCLSVAKVSYGREAILPNASDRNKDTATHRLVVYDLKGAWTKSNRNVAFALFDTFVKNKQMKKNLSPEALKGFRKETNTTPLKRRNPDGTGTPPNAAVQCLQSTSTMQDTPSPINKIQSGLAANMLQQLIAEAENKPVVYSDDLSSATRQQHLQGVQACQEDDIQHKNWHIALVNAQVLLKGCETKGYVILSAAKAEIHQRVHRPVWKDRTLVSKTTWTGRLECMQYYATVNAGENDSVNENIMWLTVDNIQERDETEISEPSEVPNMVGSGVSVGAVVSDTVGASSASQLQRIVSRCKCEFFYASYGDISVDPGAVGEVPPPPQEDVSPWDRNRQTAVDAFTLMHYDLNVCTNSLQYAMLLDIVNNLLLYVDPHRKEALERLARMRFQLQLHSVEDQRRPIQNQQTLVRTTVSKLRRLEKETHLVNKALAEDPNNIDLMEEMERLERLVYECKNQLNAQSEELDIMLSCYKESQLLATSRLATTRSDKPLTVVRANEICFKQGQWRLTEADGQIGIADLLLSNFLYTKNSKSDDSVEHLLELGYLRMTNLLPNEIYEKVLYPTEIQFNMPVEHKRVLRIFCRERPPVGGISVKEHFEINMVPLTIGLTKKFYNTMMKFCFPERDTDIEYTERSEDPEIENKVKKPKRRNRDSNFYVHIDDVEKMKERAEKNKLFVYIKIPEVPVRVSYKGNKEKNLEDLRDMSLTIPTLEYHNMTWTWLDLLMAIRNDTRRVIVSQAIKQKLQIKRNTGSLDENALPQEEDKARMLFGTRHANENKTTKKGVGGVFKFTK